MAALVLVACGDASPPESPSLRGSVEALAFGEVILGQPKIASVLVTNVGDGLAKIEEPQRAGTAPTAFELVRSDWPLDLGSQGALLVDIRYRATELGVHEATLRIEAPTPLLAAGGGGSGGGLNSGIEESAPLVVTLSGTTVEPPPVDADGDGFVDIAQEGGDDCDDTDAEINPGAVELCGDLVDNDCDGTTDLVGDADGDTADFCVDCDDEDPLRNPGASESCNGIDDNCDGFADEGLAFLDWYVDLDDDGFGAELSEVEIACTAPTGKVNNNEDCDDVDPEVNPDEVETCNVVDDDCNGIVDDNLENESYFYDFDGDGFGGVNALAISNCEPFSGFVANNLDCDDTDLAIFPGATETCNGIDDDCNDSVDDGLPTTTFFPDADGDTFVDLSATPLDNCQPIPGFAEATTFPPDCNDSEATVFPGAFEACDGFDSDCDASTEAPGGEQDDDGDGVVACADCDDTRVTVFPGAVEACDGLDTDCDASTEPFGGETDVDGDFSLSCVDCDDNDVANYPGNTEDCDAADNDCDGTPDNGLLFQDLFPDLDGDGFGDEGGTATNTCAFVPNTAANNTDCDDANAFIFPGFPELCDGEDNDCDETTFALGLENDGDGDGSLSCADCDDADAGNRPGAAEACDGNDNNCDGEVPSDEFDGDGDGALACNDCDDADATRSPLNTEICNGIDDDCNDATAAGGGEEDSDGDGFIACAECDDGDGNNFPGNVETCDGLDNNCNNLADEDGEALFFPDADTDGFGDSGAQSTTACSPPAGMVTDNTDCDDTDININPDATELCNGIDDDCDAGTFAGVGEGDGDSDLSLACADCDDADANNFPGNTELCDGADNDCDQVIDNNVVPLSFFPDTDTDGFGDANASATTGCVIPLGFVVDNTDCDDNAVNNFPGNTEVCDGADNDCNATTFATGGEGDGDTDTSFACADCDDNEPLRFPGNLEVCDGIDNDCDQIIPANESDGDQDGVRICENDCDDGDVNNFPGNPEVCDGADNDCDQVIDNDTSAQNWFVDADTDNFGDENATAVLSCTPIAGSVTNNTDCNDADSNVNPSVVEVCNGIDDDCDGIIPANETDDDSDTFNECADGDCDDTDVDIFLGAQEVCDGADSDCNGSIPANETDGDNDGVRICGNDCDDNDPLRFPGNTEVCDGIDNDCDDIIPANESDGDNDGESPCAGDCDDGDFFTFSTATEICDGADNDCDLIIPPEETDDDGDGDNECLDNDCDDTDGTIFVGAAEVCDGADSDCDGNIPANEADNDNDGALLCDGTECNDNDPNVFFGAPELCDGQDSNCNDGIPDDEVDDDLDRFVECDPWVGTSSLIDGGGDCDNDDPNRFPTNPEICDAVDNDCNLIVPVDEIDNDDDGDSECLDNDCDDTDDTIFVGATETCDGVDQDCDSAIDQTFDFDTDGAFTDADAGCIATYGAEVDCDDLDDTVFPGAPDPIGDGIDQNCDGTDGGFLLVDGGAEHNCALASSGTVECWGFPNLSVTNVPAGTYDEVAAGGFHSCATDAATGAVSCWGLGTSNQTTPPGGSFDLLDLGFLHSCGIDSGGAIQCWGDNTSNQSSPTPPGSFVALSAGDATTCAVEDTGNVLCWGSNTNNVATPPAGSFVDLSVGTDHACAIDGGGALQCWGDDGFGKATPPGGNFIDVGVGQDHSCALSAAGSLLCWGVDDGSAADLGQVTNAPTTGSFVSVGAGDLHTCAASVGGLLSCWGDSAFNKLVAP